MTYTGDQRPVSILEDPERMAANAAYFRSGLWGTRWAGVRVMRCVEDLFAYARIIDDTRPQVVIETGTWYGGGTLFLAHVCESIGRGRVVTVDIDTFAEQRENPRVAYVRGDSVSPATVAAVLQQTGGACGMVILDSCHSHEHVAAEMEMYAPMVAVGNYLVVEDTNLNGHPVLPDFGPGPWEAVQAFLPRHSEFEIDYLREPYITFAPGGYLRRVR